MDVKKEYGTVQYKGGAANDRRDSVPTEASVDIYLCGTRLVTLQATPNRLKELAVGFLLCEGLLEDISEYDTSTVDADKREVKIEAKDKSKVLARLLEKGEVIRTSGCSRGMSFGGYEEIEEIESELRVHPQEVVEMVEKMLNGAKLHRTCGGVHCSALVKGAAVASVSEDVGRHNTIDRIVGECSLKGIDMSDGVLVTTGRVSSEMVAKCARGRIPIIASLTSPTDLALDVAKNLGITVVGYARGKRFTVYTHGDRVEE